MTTFTEQLINRRTEDGKWLQGCDHTTLLLNPKIRNQFISQSIKDLTKYINKFDSIVCCGVSGLLIVPTISEIIKKNIVVVRKENEKRYSPFQYEGVVPSNYIIIDDLICSGDTVKHILNTLKEDCPSSKCIGVYTFIKDKCVYRKMPSLCKRDLKIDYL